MINININMFYDERLAFLFRLLFDVLPVGCEEDAGLLD